MSDDWGKTTNLRLPKDKSEPDFGATVVNYRFQEEEEPRQTQQQPQQQKPPQKEGGGIPIWLWGVLAGFGGLIFLAIVGVLLYFIFAASPGFTLIIEGAPSNSRVFVDGVERSITSSKGNYKVHDLRAGRRNIRITSDGYADYNGSVVGNDGDEKRLPVTMAKIDGDGKGNGNGNGGGKGDPIDEMGKRIEKELQEVGRTSVYGINFDFNSDVVKSESIPILKKIAEVLNKHPEWKRIDVEGHTDSDGTPAYNLKLSDRRAKAVRSKLIGFGVPSDRLNAVGYGLGRPIASNDTEEGKAKNRRVELFRQR